MTKGFVNITIAVGLCSPMC